MHLVLRSVWNVSVSYHHLSFREMSLCYWIPLQPVLKKHQICVKTVAADCFTSGRSLKRGTKQVQKNHSIEKWLLAPTALSHPLLLLLKEIKTFSFEHSRLSPEYIRTVLFDIINIDSGAGSSRRRLRLKILRITCPLEYIHIFTIKNSRIFLLRYQIHIEI